MTIGDLVLVNAFMIQLYIPLNFLGVHLSRDQAGAGRHGADVRADRGERRDRRRARRAAARRRRRRGALRARRLRLRAEPADPVRRVASRFPAGQTVAVVGPSGSGKSHAGAAAVSASTTSTAGASRSTARTSATCSRRALRAAIGIVPQDTVLFNDSIEYNIALRPARARRTTRSSPRRSSRRSTTSSRALPEGYATPVGERGLKLSGGEKQRVAIARAILKDPRDPDLRRGDVGARFASPRRRSRPSCGRSRANRTTLTIAHRLSTIVDADEILVLDHGRIVERGTHVALAGGGRRLRADVAAAAGRGAAARRAASPESGQHAGMPSSGSARRHRIRRPEAPVAPSSAGARCAATLRSTT